MNLFIEVPINYNPGFSVPTLRSHDFCLAWGEVRVNQQPRGSGQAGGGYNGPSGGGYGGPSGGYGGPPPSGYPGPTQGFSRTPSFLLGIPRPREYFSHREVSPRRGPGFAQLIPGTILCTIDSLETHPTPTLAPGFHPCRTLFRERS